jgi:hypothetical protein
MNEKGCKTILTYLTTKHTVKQMVSFVGSRGYNFAVLGYLKNLYHESSDKEFSDLKRRILDGDNLTDEQYVMVQHAMGREGADRHVGYVSGTQTLLRSKLTTTSVLEQMLRE